MDAVDYLKALKRICKEFNPMCPDCPAFPLCGASGDHIRFATPEKITKAVEDVEAWKEEHPAKTRTAKLLEVFPNVDVNAGFPDICPRRLEPSYKVQCNEIPYCTDCERKYWTEEIE